MKKAAKKKAKGRPRKANKMKVIQIAATVTPEQMAVLKKIMKKYKLDLSKAIRWAVFNCGESGPVAD
jgi:hypothetical protein